MFPVFNGLKGMAAVWALKFERRKNLFSVYKGLSADLALKLSAAAGVVIDVFIWSTARGHKTCRYGMLLAFLGF